MLSVLTVLVVLAVLAVLFVAAALATREGDILRDAPADAPDLGLPVGEVQPEDVAELRFGLAVRGYRMSEVDEVLARLAHELADRDSRIAKLEQALVDVVEPALEQGIATAAPAPEQPAPEQAVAEPVVAEPVVSEPAEPDDSAEPEAEPEQVEPDQAEQAEQVEPEEVGPGWVEPVEAAPVEVPTAGVPSALAEWPDLVQPAFVDALGEADDAFPEVYLPGPADADLPEAISDEPPAPQALSVEEPGSDQADVSKPLGEPEPAQREPEPALGEPGEGFARGHGDSTGERVDGG